VLITIYNQSKKNQKIVVQKFVIGLTYFLSLHILLF